MDPMCVLAVAPLDRSWNQWMALIVMRDTLIPLLRSQLL